jgi:hypothetical protein
MAGIVGTSSTIEAPILAQVRGIVGPDELAADRLAVALIPH